MGSDQEELTIKLCKLGGPLVLFICFPFLAFVIGSITFKEVKAGRALALAPDATNFLILVPILWFGIWMCRRGYGWFGGTRPE